jgi:hypothetical protein
VYSLLLYPWKKTLIFFKSYKEVVLQLIEETSIRVAVPITEVLNELLGG